MFLAIDWSDCADLDVVVGVEVDVAVNLVIDVVVHVVVDVVVYVVGDSYLCIVSCVDALCRALYDSCLSCVR